MEWGVNLYSVRNLISNENGYIETCKKITQNGGKAYLKSTIMNKSVESGQIERVNDWKEIYDKIQEYIKE